MSLSGPETPLVPWAHPEVPVKALGSPGAKAAFLGLHLIKHRSGSPPGAGSEPHYVRMELTMYLLSICLMLFRAWATATNLVTVTS